MPKCRTVEETAYRLLQCAEVYGLRPEAFIIGRAIVEEIKRSSYMKNLPPQAALFSIPIEVDKVNPEAFFLDCTVHMVNDARFIVRVMGDAY